MRSMLPTDEARDADFDMTDQRVRLADGRDLGWASFGDPAGPPILLFHGFPGSRLDGRLADEAARKAGTHIIAVDRPGYGLSDFKPGRRIADWPDDVVELADSLGLERFAAMGISGGGPYAAACARFISKRLSAAAIVCGVGPFDAPGATEGMSLQNRLVFGVSRWAPGLIGLAMRPMRKLARDRPEKFVARIQSSLPDIDKEVVGRPQIRDAMVASSLEASRQGMRGISQEAGLYARPWGFELTEIPMRVHLFQGEKDRNVPPVMGRFQAAAIPDCQAHFFPEDGHMSLAVDRQPEILACLTQTPQ